MLNYKSSSNMELYQNRTEPVILQSSNDWDYINLRTCDDSDVLEALEKELEQYSIDGVSRVVVPWFSPPFNRVVGYGIYTKKEARLLSHRDDKEGWGFPCFGRAYGLKKLKAMIKKCAEPSTL